MDLKYFVQKVLYRMKIEAIVKKPLVRPLAKNFKNLNILSDLNLTHSRLINISELVTFISMNLFDWFVKQIHNWEIIKVKIWNQIAKIASFLSKNVKLGKKNINCWFWHFFMYFFLQSLIGSSKFIWSQMQKVWNCYCRLISLIRFILEVVPTTKAFLRTL